MTVLDTQHFGRISCVAESIIEFRGGLPGFEQRRKFAALQFADRAPLIFLQSLEEPGLCFITLPVLAVDPMYRLAVGEEDLARLELPLERQPLIGDEVLCLAIVALHESGPTANLLAPVVVNLRNRKAVQAVAAESGYSHQQALIAQEAPVC